VSVRTIRLLASAETNLWSCGPSFTSISVTSVPYWSALGDEPPVDPAD